MKGQHQVHQPNCCKPTSFYTTQLQVLQSKFRLNNQQQNTLLHGQGPWPPSSVHVPE
jgi:hypothetical protein